MLIIDQIAEARIEQAITRGELDNLAGQGRPLQLEDDRMVPEEYRMAYRIMKNAGLVPPALDVKNQIHSMEEALSALDDVAEQDRIRKKLQCLYLRLENTPGRKINLALEEEYYRKVLARLGKDVTVGE